MQEEENFLGTVQSMPYRTRVSVIGASMSEPHIDEFAVKFVYVIYIYI